MNIQHRATKRVIGLLLTLIMLTGVIATAAMPATAAVNNAVRDDRNGILQIRAYPYLTGDVSYSDGSTKKYSHVNVFNILQGYDGCYVGTAFLINSSHVLTCNHIVDETMWDNVVYNNSSMTYGDYMDLFRGWGCTIELEYEIVVNKDVTIGCSIVNKSVKDDFAIVKLDQPLGSTKILGLADSDNVSQTQSVYALGFPSAVAKADSVYDSNDVTVSEGIVQKVTSQNNTKEIQHSATLAGGNSGGPLVDDRGAVIGVNHSRATSGDDFYWAIAINEIKVVLKRLNIEFIDAEAETDPDPDPTDSDPTESDATETEETTPEPTTADPTESKDSGESSGVNYLLIILIAAGVILVAIIVAIIVLLTKKNKGQKPPMGPGAPGGRPGMTGAPVPPAAPIYNRPAPPRNTYATYGEGSEGTSLLVDDAGETTVLGVGSVGVTLVRKSSGERIVINKPEFIIGKERSRVDYCISGNSSVSRTHAKFRVRSGRCYISDLGSTNCTFVNGSKLAPNQEVILSKGDVIKMSDEEFIFEG